MKPATLLLAALAIGVMGLGVTQWLKSDHHHYFYESVTIDDTHIRSDHNGSIVELRNQQQQLVVTSVPSDGFFGLQAGDVIRRVDNQPVSTVESLRNALRANKTEQASFTVERQGHPLDLNVARAHGFDRFI